MMSNFISCISETCTAPKNRGGGGTEDEKNLNVVAMAATARKPFRVAARPLRASHFNKGGAAASPGGRLIISRELLSRSFLQMYSLTWSHDVC